MAKRPSSLERIAYHEAGHAVIAVELRITFKRVSIIEDEQSLGRVLFDPPDFLGPDVDGDAKTNSQIEKHIICGLAGMAAEHKLVGRNNWRGASSDVDCAIDLALHRFRPDVAGPYIDYLKARVRAHIDLPFTWKAIEGLAEALLEKQELSARNVRKVIKSIRFNLVNPSQ